MSKSLKKRLQRVLKQWIHEKKYTKSNILLTKVLKEVNLLKKFCLLKKKKATQESDFFLKWWRVTILLFYFYLPPASGILENSGKSNS